MKAIENNDITKNIYTYAFFNYIGSIMVFIISFFIFIFLTKRLNIEQFGQYNLVLNTQFFLSMLLNFGLTTIIVRFVPEYIARKDLFIAKKIIFTSIIITFLVGLAAAFLSVLMFDNLAGLFNKFFIREYIFLIIILGILRAEVILCECCFSAFLRQRYKVSFEVVGMFLKLILFFYSLKLGFGLLGIVLSVGIIDLFLFLTYFFRIHFYLGKATESHVDFNKIRIIKFAAKEYLNKFLSFFWYTKIDGYIVTPILGLASAGIYYFVLNIISILAEFLPGPLMLSVSVGVFSRQFTKYGNKKEIIYLFKLYNKINAFFIFPIFVVFFLLTDKILAIFFKKYVASAYLFPLILLTVFLYILGMSLKNVLTTIERNEISIYSSSVVLYKIPAAIFLTKRFGLIGSALALASTILLHFIIQLFLTKRYINVSYPWMSFFKILLNSMAAGILVLILKPFINNIFFLFLFLLIAATVYLVASFFNKVFDDYDRQILNKSFGKIILNF